MRTTCTINQIFVSDTSGSPNEKELQVIYFISLAASILSGSRTNVSSLNTVKPVKLDTVPSVTTCPS